MMIFVVGIAFALIAYGKAKRTGRNPIHWALIAFATFIATQIVVSGGLGFVFGLGEELWGWSENLFERHQLHITIVSLLACSFTNWLATSCLNRMPEISQLEPPPAYF